MKRIISTFLIPMCVVLNFKGLSEAIQMYRLSFGQIEAREGQPERVLPLRTSRPSTCSRTGRRMLSTPAWVETIYFLGQIRKISNLKYSRGHLMWLLWAKLFLIIITKWYRYPNYLFHWIRPALWKDKAFCNPIKRCPL